MKDPDAMEISNQNITSQNVTGGNSTRGFQWNLTDWQKSKLIGVSPQGIRCYLESWLRLSYEPIEDPYCDAAWDEVYCWPATPAGENVSRACSEVMKDDPEIPNASEIVGNAFRICTENGTWEWDGWTNYNECLEGLADTPVLGLSPSAGLVDAVRYISFVGSVLSFVCLITSLFIFYYFKSLRCDRITVHIHLMVSLTMRFLLMIVITEPLIFQRSTHYRNVEWICKLVMALQLYATVASTSWMFVHGHYLHAKVTTNVFDRGTPFKSYFAIGWGIPVIIISIWAWVMETHNNLPCWKNYGKSTYIWIVVGPIMVALVVNLLFLVNIMRILLTKIQLATVSSDSTQLRRAVKATVVLFPLLGVNNLLFLFNPGGDYEAAYYITNAVLQSSQGVIVSILYCFMSKEVRAAIRREYRKATVKRTATMRQNTFRSTIRGRRWSSSYANQNSVYWDNPTSVTLRSSFHHRASILLSKIKQPTTLLTIANDQTTGGLSLTDGSATNGHAGQQPTWTTNSAIMPSTPSPETVGFLPNCMAVTFTRNSSKSNSIQENKSDSENNEISMQNGLVNNHCCRDFQASHNQINGESLERNDFPPGIL